MTKPKGEKDLTAVDRADPCHRLFLIGYRLGGESGNLKHTARPGK